MRKRIIILVVVVLILGWLIKSNQKTYDYVYVNRADSVATVELLSNQNHNGQGTDWDYIYSIRFLSAEEIQPFIERVRQIPTSETYSAFSGWGSYIAKVTYSNGDVEMLGTQNIEHIRARRGYLGYSFYRFDGDEFRQLFEEYIEPGKYPFYS